MSWSMTHLVQFSFQPGTKNELNELELVKIVNSFVALSNMDRTVQ